MISRTQFISFSSGALFGIGLIVAGMTQPQNIIGFLSLGRHWNSQLFFVMLAATFVHSSYYFIIKPQFKTPIWAATYHTPTRNQITFPLLFGAILFGIGWGLAGYCPGPAILSLASLNDNSFIFTFAMLLGLFLFQKIENRIPMSKPILQQWPFNRLLQWSQSFILFDRTNGLGKRNGKSYLK